MLNKNKPKISAGEAKAVSSPFQFISNEAHYEAVIERIKSVKKSCGLVQQTLRTFM